MIDIHSHILPGVDDGARSVSQALDMLRCAIDQGVTRQVLTPHIHMRVFNNTLEDLTQSFILFQEAVAQAGLSIHLQLASECRIGPEVIAMVRDNKLPCLGKYQGMKTFLLEFPRTEIPHGSDNLIRWLLSQNYLPIIVHPERNCIFLKQDRKLQALVELGCLLQITASSLTGKFGAEVQAMSERLLLAKQVIAIASDCHNLKGRAPDLRYGFEKAASIIGIDKAKKLVGEYPLRLCCT